LQSLLSFPREVGDDMNLSVRFHATVLAPGFALGNAFFIRERPLPPSGEPSDLPDALRELHMFKQSVVRAVEELESLIEQLERGRSPEPADIARAHLAMLSDSGFHEDIQRKIATQGLQAERAVEEVIHELVILFERSENEVLAERSADLKDLELRLKAALGGQPHDVFRSIASADNHIALVDELLPSYVFDAHTHHVSGFLVTKGTPLAHAVILARHYGMPVLKMEHLSRIENGTALLLDGANGYVVMEPDEAMIRDVLPARQPSHVPETHESLPAALWLSIIDPQQLDAGVLADAAGIGLYRTEMLFMKHSHDFPAEDEQYRVYRSLFEKCGGKPVTIRTLDIGGDKLLPYFSLGPQANPYMGFRAHRIWRFHPEILVCQIRAIMRAAGHEGRLRILYPMIETVDSLAFVQELVRDAVASLRRQGEPIPDRYEEGLLIEVPSAVWDYSALLARVDYASLGTNDLLQYFFAADRNNPNISSFYVPEHPAVIRMLHWIVDKNAQANKPRTSAGKSRPTGRTCPCWSAWASVISASPRVCSRKCGPSCPGSNRPRAPGWRGTPWKPAARRKFDNCSGILAGSSPNLPCRTCRVKAKWSIRSAGWLSKQATRPCPSRTTERPPISAHPSAAGSSWRKPPESPPSPNKANGVRTWGEVEGAGCRQPQSTAMRVRTIPPALTSVNGLPRTFPRDGGNRARPRYGTPRSVPVSSHRVKQETWSA
jgi:phosphotransferase system enzyme I (PtsI)